MRAGGRIIGCWIAALAMLVGVACSEDPDASDACTDVATASRHFLDRDFDASLATLEAVDTAELDDRDLAHTIGVLTDSLALTDTEMSNERVIATLDAWVEVNDLCGFD